MQKIHKNILHTLTILCTLLLLLWMPKASAQTTATFSKTYNSSSTITITIPASATNITVKAWGGGGGGSSSNSGGNKSGGGGGAYSERTWATLSAGTYTIVVGSGGGSNSSGGDSRFYLNSNTDLVLAKGGNGGSQNSTTGATGGQANDGVGTITVNGSDGANSSGNTGGAGGNAGGTTANPGGTGGAARSSTGTGSSGNLPGGGGGGARGGSSGWFGTTYSGGSGGTGRVIVSYDYIDYPTPALMGSGSRDLYPSGVSGHRAGLLGAGYTAPAAIPYPNSGAHFVYANEGETITLASSAQGNSSAAIQMWNPSGTRVVNSSGPNGQGNIPNRAAELAGPAMIGVTPNDNRYIPIYYTVPAGEGGIYRVEFTARSTSGAQPHILANSNWTQGNHYTIHAWDVAVINAAQTSFIPGRTYVTNMNLSNGNEGNSGTAYQNVQFNGRVFVRTRDGYTYKVKHNGTSGIVFAFFVNNLGFKTTPTSNIASYKSLNQTPGVAAASIHNPNIPDNANNITHKMFYTMPSDDLPATANASIGIVGSTGSTPVHNSSTWLKTAPVEPNVTNLQLLGVEGTEGFFGHKGGHILFDAPIDGQEYEIQVILPAYDDQVFHTINGTTVNGQNSIYWNGTGSATIDGEPITSLAGLGDTDVDIKVQLRGAEVHFPFFDMEYNQGGISVELLDYKNINYTNPDNTPVVSNIVYWDDSDIPLGSNPNSGTEALRRRSNPQNNSHTVGSGQNSTNNGHIYGQDGSGATGTFGDEKSLDTWTFIEGTSQTIHSLIDVKEADLYTNVSYTINGSANPTSATVGQSIVYTVTAGNHGPSDVIANSSLNRKGAAFTFQVPGGVLIDHTNVVKAYSTCANGTASEEIPLAYNASTRMFTAELNLPDDCTVTYTFTGTLVGAGGQVAEATIMRPADVTDPDATNPVTEGGAPTNPHFECYNNDPTLGDDGAILCNNITEALFMILEDCVESVLYYEDFDRGYFAVNSGRTDWVNQPSISVTSAGVIQRDPITGAVIRNGEPGGATSAYLFAPGINDTRYATANTIHGSLASVARIKAGYYSVNPPGYVQMGIPDTDSWKIGIWDPNATTNDPNDPTSNYDWTRAWDQGGIRDMSGAVNGSAFLVRGSASASDGVRPFYEFNIPTTLQEGDTYTLNLYSYVTYHNRDYIVMDVVDQVSGQVYASVPLVNPEIQSNLPVPVGVQFGWISLTASFSLDEEECSAAVGKNVKIAIRGSKDRTQTTGGGFGHTLIDNILFTKRVTGGSCIIAASPLECALDDVCYDDIDQQGFNTTGTHTITQDNEGDGFILDVFQLNSTLNVTVDGGALYEDGSANPVALEFGTTGQNVRFKADGARWGQGGVPTIDQINSGATINITDRRANSVSPAVKVIIDAMGNVSLWGKRSNGSALEELEVFGVIGGQLNNYPWKGGTGIHNVTVTVGGSTSIAAVGYARELKDDCATCVLDKEGLFNDENADGRAKVGETITYTFDVKNAGDMDIVNILISDPLFGFNISIHPDTHQVIQPSGTTITFTGDQNANGILERHETWTFTVSYTVKQQDINNRGVYNRAVLTGSGYVVPDSERQFSVQSFDPTPYDSNSEGWDSARPFHTFVLLKGQSYLITNPMIRQKVE